MAGNRCGRPLTAWAGFTGAYREPEEGVLSDITMPSEIFHRLLTGFTASEGEDLARDYTRGKVAHPGDPFGEVFAWLWDNRRSTAIALTADLLATARGQADSKGQAVSLDDFLAGLRFALHATHLAHHREFEKVEAVLRRRVPEYFGDGELNE